MLNRAIRAGIAASLLLVLSSLASAGAEPGSRHFELRARAEAATRPYAETIKAWSEEYQVDPALVMAVITVESRGDQSAVSSSGAMGLMQLMPAACIDYGVADPFDPDQNIRGGVAFLARQIGRYKGDLKRVLAAYNAGPRRADNGSWVRIEQTRKYVPKVLSYYNAIRMFKDDLPEYMKLGGTYTLPPVLPSGGKAITFLDGMFETVRTSPGAVAEGGLAENGTLSDAADVILGEYLSGKLDSKNTQARAERWVADADFQAKSLRAFLITTSDPNGFAAAWGKQGSVPGRLVGLAHGSRKGTHVWVVVLSSV